VALADNINASQVTGLLDKAIISPSKLTCAASTTKVPLPTCNFITVADNLKCPTGGMSPRSVHAS
jgi:hypothetical protein